MRSKRHGANISNVEVTNISPHGIWLWVKQREFFLSHADYPWFKGARKNDVYAVKLLRGMHLYWPNLDVDLDVSTLEDPALHPLIFQ